MYVGLDAVEERGEQERVLETRVPPPSWRPRGEPAAVRPRERLHRSADRCVAFLVRVEKQARPLGCGKRARDEMRDGDRNVGHERLILCSQSAGRLLVGLTQDDHCETSRSDPGPHVHRNVEGMRSHLLEPEARLLHEVEREPVRPGRPRRLHGSFELDRLPGLDSARERCPDPVPHDRVPEWIEPVIRKLDAPSAAGVPCCAAGVLEPDARPARDAGPRLLEVVRAPADGERTHRHRVLADVLHQRSSLGRMEAGEISVESVTRRFRVHARDARTLKDLFVQRGRTEPTDVWALRDVSLAIEPGDAVGLIGRNGSGKTTLLRLVAGIIKPTTGRVQAGGRIGSLLELGAGFHLDFTGRENVFLNGAIQGLRRAEIRERFD